MGLLDRLRRTLGGAPEVLPAGLEDEERLTLPDGLPEQLRTVETAALDIYRRHGLPCEQASYCRKGPDAPWEVIPGPLSPEQKWQLVQSAPAGAGWRFGDRAAVGRQSPVEEVRNAATLLGTCDTLKRKLAGDGPVTAQDVADAVLLGTAAGVLMAQGAVLSASDAHVPLSFVPVEDDEEA